MSQWCLIESDPGVLTELIEKLGVKGVQCEELYDPSVEELQRVDPVYGLIFLFKYGGETSAKQAPIKHCVESLYFAKQMVTNACATQAVMNILMNVPNLDLGTELAGFKDFTSGLPSDLRGEAIGASDVIRTVHNSFARQEIFSIESSESSSEDAFHFLAYVPFNGRLYELDGLNQGPVDHGPIETGSTSWYEVASKAVTTRIQQFASDEIRFNLCALVKDRREVLSEKITSLKSSNGNAAEINDLEARIASETAKRERYAAESARRKHNYIPVFLETMRQLARAGKLESIVADAKAKQKTRVEEAKKKRADGKEVGGK